MLGQKILITRQDKFAAGLTAQLTAHGATCIAMPLFAIESILTPGLLAQIHNDLPRCDLGVMVSRNAAEVVLQHLDPNLDLQWAAIGPATAACVQPYSRKNVIYPLQAPLFDLSLLNKFVIVFQGAEGNKWLSQELHQQGARVKVIEVYKRVLPDISRQQVAQIFGAQPALDIILITCVTSLLNLLQLAAKSDIKILHIPLLVVSARIYQFALDMGFLNVYTAKGMSDVDIVSAVKNLNNR